MIFSVSSLISTVFTSSLVIMILWLYLRNIQRMAQIGTKGVFIVICIIIIRLVLPAEFKFTTTIFDEHIMVEIQSFLNNRIHVLGNSIGILSLLFIFWIFGMLIKVVFVVKNRVAFSKYIRSLSVIQNKEFDEIIESITAKYKKPPKFRWVQSDAIGSPALYGIIRPTIIVPTEAIADRKFTKEEWRYILMHEVAHHYHRDLQIRILVEGLNIIYWWNPLVHFLNRQVDEIIEIRADEAVIKDLNSEERIEYLECILKTVKIHPIGKKNIENVMTFNKEKRSLLYRRGSLILESPATKKTLFSNLMIVLMASMLCFSLTTIFEPSSIPADVAEETFMLTRENSFLVKASHKEGYDIYIDDQFAFSSEEMHESFEELEVYDNLQEAKNDREKKQKKTFGSFISDITDAVDSVIRR